MPFDPIVNFEAGRIPDPSDEANFHLDATYVFNHLAENVIPDFNSNLDWLDTALSGSETLIDSVADIISGAQALASLDVAGNSSVDGSLTVKSTFYVGRSGGGDSRISFHDDNSDTWRSLYWDDSLSDWRIEDSSGAYRKIWTNGNDGTGSGLDADKLDGAHLSQIARTDIAETFSDALNVEGTLNVGKNGGGDSRISLYDDNSNTWRSLMWDDSLNDWRIEDNGGSYRELWHSGNDGAGSGLDADKLDGAHLSQIARTDVGSETFTGDVVVQGNMHVGKSGGGSSNLQFHDDNSNTWRNLYWSDGGNEFRLEDQSGSFHAITTEGNLSAHIAAKSVGAIGTYAWLGKPTDGKITQGTAYAGNTLKYAGSLSTTTFSDNTAMDITGTSPIGTWRAMGRTDHVTTRNSATLFLRIS
jgi:hypothetical protein